MRFIRGAWLWVTDHLTITVPYWAEAFWQGVSGGWLDQHRDWQRRKAL